MSQKNTENRPLCSPKSALFGNVSFAVGCCMLESRRDVRAALARADKLMYEDKANCYRQNPNLKRRD